MDVILLAVQSVDGFITQHDIPGSRFASAEDQAHFSRTLQSCDCSVMGRETYAVSRDFIRARLTAQRLRIVLTRSPETHAADTVPGALEFSAANPERVMADLRSRGMRRCAVLGGAAVNASFLRLGLVDELWLTLEPRLFGGGTPLLRETADVRLKLQSCEPLSADTLLLKYAVCRRPQT